MATASPLRRRMIEDMTVRNLSRSTQQSYIYAVAKFGRHFNCPPDRLGMEDVRAYQLHLMTRDLFEPSSIPAEVARRSGMMSLTDSEMISPTVPR